MYNDYLFYDDLSDEYIKIESVDYNGEFAIIALNNGEWTTWYPVEESLLESMEVAGYKLVSYSGDRLDVIKKVIDNNSMVSDLHAACVYNDTWRAVSDNPDDY